MEISYVLDNALGHSFSNEKILELTTAIKELAPVAYTRHLSVLLRFDILFRLTPTGKEFFACQKKLHDWFASLVLEEKKVYDRK